MKLSITIAIIGTIAACMMCDEQPATAQNANICEQVTGIPKSEYETLVTLYNSTDGDNWGNKKNWLTTNTPCGWYGVKCIDGHVAKLSLSNNQLSGSIPPELGNLANLCFLYLNSNQLSGSIPSELSKLTNLENLHLPYNQLSGRIPSELGKLTKLQEIYLNNNQLSGRIPSELGELTKLQGLYLNNNQLRGRIPPELGNLVNLTKLDLFDNQLSGKIPPELGNLVNLTKLGLSDNHLSGKIPPELGNLTNLIHFNLSNNQLSGFLPLHLMNITTLYSFDFSNTNLCIPVDMSFQKWLADIQIVKSFGINISCLCNNETEIPKTECEALSTLYISTNGDHWKSKNGWGQTIFPCSWDHVTCYDGHITKLSLSENGLKGRLPPALGDLPELTHLDLNSNQLKGSIPPELSRLRKLKYLDLSDNQLSGRISLEPDNLATLKHLDLSGNQLGGILSSKLSTFTRLEYLDLSDNQLSGGILLEPEKLVTLKHLDLSGNLLRGKIPPELSNLTNLTFLDLSGNQLSGRIPSEPNTLTDLEYLNLSGNQLCEPTDTSFRRWVNSLEFYDDTCRICYSDLYGWLPVLTIILGSSLLISGIMMGVYASLKQIYGTSYDYLFGYSRNETNMLKITGLLNRVILTGGLFSILGGVCGLTVVSYKKIGDSLILLGILLGVVTGILYSLFSRKEKIYNRTAGYEKIFEDDIFNYLKKTWKTSSSTIVVGLFTGMIISAITAGLFGEMTHGDAGMLAGVMTGVVVGGVAGFFGGLASTMTGWFPGGVVGGIAGGIAGHLAYYRLSHLAGFTLVKDSSLSEGIGMGIAGAVSGIIVGYIVGLIISLIAAILTRIILFIMMMVNKLVSVALIPSLIVSRFKTIICGNCLRYTEPLKSRYEDGRRYCERCHEEVDDTSDPGIVILTFGDDTPSRSDGRTFILSNPDFEQKDQPIDVSKVYIEPKTSDKRLLERFITFIINYPPKPGIRSIQIFYEGELDDLGMNLRNVLQNTFTHIEKID